MKFDDIFPVIGDFGKGQILQYSLLCFPYIIAGILSVDAVFLFAKPNFVCEPDTILLSQIENALNITNNHDIATRLYEFLVLINQEKGQCFQWNNSTNLVEALLNSNTINRNESYISKIDCGINYIYSEKSYGSTITNEFNFVCKDSQIRDNLKTVFFVGRIFGAVIFGQVSDLIGRLLTFLIVVVLNIICGIGLYFSTNTIMLGAFLLLQGFVQVGYTLTTYVLGCEMIGTSKRKIAGSVFFIFYTFAFLIIPLVYYFLMDWRILALISGVPSIAFLSYFFLVHESPRWLMSKGRVMKAYKIIEMVARRNGRQITKELGEEIKQHKPEKGAQKASILDLFKTKVLIFQTLCVMFNWVVNALIYYGIIFNTENLGPNLYINFAIMGLVEIPSLFLNMLLLDRVGRRNLLIITLLATGACCLIAGCIPKKNQYTVAVFAILGKFTVSMSYGIIYFFTFELYPTLIRNVAMGVSSTAARIGGTLAVPILSLTRVLYPLPMIIFFILSILAAGLTFFIPETMGKALDSDPNENKVNYSMVNIKPDNNDIGEPKSSDDKKNPVA